MPDLGKGGGKINEIVATILKANDSLDQYKVRLGKADKQLAKMLNTQEKVKKVSEGNIFLKMNKGLEEFLAKDKVLNKLTKRFGYLFGHFRAVQGVSASLLSVGEGLEVIKGGLDNIIPDKLQTKIGKVGKSLLGNFGPKAVWRRTGIVKMGSLMEGVEGARKRTKGGLRESLERGGRKPNEKTLDSIVGKLKFAGRKDRLLDIFKLMKENAKKTREKRDARWERMEYYFAKFIDWSKIIKRMIVGWIVKKGVMGIGKIISKAWGQIFKFLIIGLFYISALMFMVKMFGPAIKDTLTFLWDVVSYGAGIVWSGIQKVWEGISGIFGFIFGNTSFNEMMDGLFVAIYGILQIAWGLIVAFIGPLILAIPTLLVKLWDNFKKYMTGLWNENKTKFWLTAIGIGIMIIASIQGYAVIIPALLLYVGFQLVMYGVEKIGQLFSWMGFASGGVSSGGMAIVGEKGPEFVNLPRGSKVHSNRESKKMVSTGGGNTTVNVTINAHSLQDNELRRVAQKVGDMINKQVNRSTSSSTIR